MNQIPADYADLLDKKAFWHIATKGPKGEMQSSPVWVGHEDGNIMFSLTKGRQKFRNLNADPSVALSATDPDNPYRYLEVRGTVTRVDEDPNNDFINAMAKKYMDVDVYPYSQPDDERVVMVIEPQHTSQMG